MSKNSNIWCPTRTCDAYKAPEQLCDVCKAVYQEIRLASDLAKEPSTVSKHIMLAINLQIETVSMLRLAVEEVRPTEQSVQLVAISNAMVKAHQHILDAMNAIKEKVGGPR